MSVSDYSKGITDTTRLYFAYAVVQLSLSPHLVAHLDSLYAVTIPKNKQQHWYVSQKEPYTSIRFCIGG
jgi:hypothetical protein